MATSVLNKADAMNSESPLLMTMMGSADTVTTSSWPWVPAEAAEAS